LLVEDEAEVRFMTSKCLQSLGYKVLEASDGGKALELCKAYSGPIDIVVTDVVMPKMNGYEFVEQLAPLKPAIKVVYMSGYSQHDKKVKENILKKPFSLDDLAQTVYDALRKDSTEKAS